MRIEIKKIGVIKDSSVWPQEISHDVIIKKVYYESNFEDFKRAQKEIGLGECKNIEDYIELVTKEEICWDSDRRVFIKEIKSEQ